METVQDKYIDHETHNTFLEGCSTCFAENLLVHSGRECIGCNQVGNLTRCNGTMCQFCWSRENEE